MNTRACNYGFLCLPYRCTVCIFITAQPPTALTTTLHPVHNNERIQLMDALRGLAILGIFIANLGVGFSFYEYKPDNAGPYFHPWDHAFLFLERMFIEGKFYSIFSFLFGWGMALQLQRSEAKGISPVSFMRRRLTVMLLLGLAHLLLLWPGDIVAFYALVGFVFLWIRNWSSRTLLFTAIGCLVLPVLLYYLKMQFPVLLAPAGLLFNAGGWVDAHVSGISGPNGFAQFLSKLKSGTYLDQLQLLLSGIFYRYGDLLFQDRFFKVLGMVILGYLMGRNNRYKQLLIDKKRLQLVAVGGLLLGLPCNYLLARYMEGNGYGQMQTEGLLRTVVYALGVAPLALTYMSLFFLLALTKGGQLLIRVQQPAGKMAFTNYILHSVIGMFVFYGAGLGLLQEVGPVVYTGFAWLVFVVQVLASTLWLHYFKFGPVEWLWRSATYGKWQALRK